MDQLKDGVYLLVTEENVVFDSLEMEKKRVYETEIQLDSKTNLPKRKLSSIKTPPRFLQQGFCWNHATG